MELTGLRTFWRWFLLGAGILFFGNIAITHARVCAGLMFWQHFAEPLAYFILSGAITIGFLAVAVSWVWRAVNGRRLE